MSSSGNDSLSGTSTTAAWKNISRVNAQQLRAGDKVLFQGGKAFSGALTLTRAEGGTSTNPIVFSTYGTGRASIFSGDTSGIDITDAGGVSISNLRFVGSGMNTNKGGGIYLHAVTAGLSLSYLRVNNVEALNYGWEGVSIYMGKGGISSLSDVRIERSSFHDNLTGGIQILASGRGASRNYTIDHVRAYNNPGATWAGSHTGSGIYLAGVDTALVQRCVAYNNGKNGKAPVGIWAAGSNRVTFQYNESYGNHTANATDGGGFNFDWDTTNCLMQYNYSHGNDGPAFLLGAGSHVNSGNVIRYNISENDGRRNGRAAIHLWGNITNAAIYNNVIYMPYTGNANSAAVFCHNVGAAGLAPNNVQIRNNIFYTTGGTKLINITSKVLEKAVNFKFNGNAYHSGGGAFKIQWGDTTSYSSLTSWRNATGQERTNGVATGYQGDPKLVAVGTGGTKNNADQLNTLGGYKLQSTSPLINRGVAPPTFFAAATIDFFGDSTPKGGKYDIGADEVA